MDRRADNFEPRARELCSATGQNPDERVPKPGTAKQWPAWCGFRQAAMDASSAQQSAAAIVGAPPQAPEYQDRPVVVFGEHDEQTLLQMNTCMKVGNVVGGVICADGHLGYAQPVGAVIAYQDQVSISGVGFDIGCGNMAVRLDVPYGAVKDRGADLLAQIRKAVSFGVGRVNDERVAHELLDDAEAWRAADREDFRQKAAAQLGTVGSGNHYVDLFRETDDIGTIDMNAPVWIGVHFGSRGLGHTSATKYLKAAGGKDGMHVAPTVVDVGSEIGQRYIAAMELAGRYAYAGREWVMERVRQIVGGEVQDTIHNHHNYAWQEHHGGLDLWVVRKGATPAFPGQRGFVGGSMGDDAVIVEGVDGEVAATAFYSTVHGAGRLFGRMQAKRTFTQAQMDDWLQGRGVALAGGDIDESPMAYRRLPHVLDQQGKTIQVLHTLRPFAVAMAGSGEYDPWKD